MSAWLLGFLAGFSTALISGLLVFWLIVRRGRDGDDHAA